RTLLTAEPWPLKRFGRERPAHHWRHLLQERPHLLTYRTPVGGDDTATHRSCVMLSTRTAIRQAPVVSAVLSVMAARPWEVTARWAESLTTPRHSDPANWNVTGTLSTGFSFTSRTCTTSVAVLGNSSGDSTSLGKKIMSGTALA